MILTSEEIGLDVGDIGLKCKLSIHCCYTRSSGSQDLCKNGIIHPESEPARVEIDRILAPERCFNSGFIGYTNIKHMLSDESLNTIEAHVLDYLEKR